MKRVLLFVCLFLGTPSFAQTLTGSMYGSSQFRFEPDFRLSEVDLGNDFELNARLALGIRSPVELGLGLRTARSFGPLGNLVVTGGADVSSAGSYDIGVAAQGVLASVALNADVGVFNTDPGTFRLEEGFEDGTRAFLNPSGLSAGLDLGASYRFERTLIGEGATGFYLTPAGAALSLDGGLRFVGINERDDGTARLLLHADPGFNGGFAAGGFRYDLKRRGLPALHGTLWLGAGSSGVFPGVSAQVSQRLRDLGGSYAVGLRLEPYRTDAPIFRANASYSQNLGEGDLILSAYAASAGLSPFTLRAGYRYSF